MPPLRTATVFAPLGKSMWLFKSVATEATPDGSTRKLRREGSNLNNPNISESLTIIISLISAFTIANGTGLV